MLSELPKATPQQAPEWEFKPYSTGPEVELRKLHCSASYYLHSWLSLYEEGLKKKGNVALFNLSWECVGQAT